MTWLGLALVVYGVYEMITSLSDDRGRSRVWGVISQPALALVTLVWFTGAWMLATGIIIVISVFLDDDRMLAA